MMLESNMKQKYSYPTQKKEKQNFGESKSHANDFQLVIFEWIKSTLKITN
jgi:hypothetical protein